MFNDYDNPRINCVIGDELIHITIKYVKENE